MKSKPLSILALSFAGLLTASCGQLTPGRPAKARIDWEWTGIIGSGQSLSVGQNGSQIASTTQPYNNLKLDSAELQWPVDPAAPEFKVVPLVEPIERRAARGGGWPINIAGETPHSSMANELTALVKARFAGQDFVSVHTNVGENGQAMSVIRKGAAGRGTNGRAYEASLIQTKALTRLAKSAGKSFGIGAIIFTHGESDANRAEYGEQIRQLWQDYNTDLPAITGQSQKILLILSQQHGLGNPARSTLAQWKAGVDFPDDIVVSGPKYQYQSGDGLHLTTDGYRQLGEKYAQVYFERVILGHKWQPLQPTGLTREGRTLTVKFHVPHAPLVWDTEMDTPHATLAEWKNGKGFEVATAGGQRVTIDSVAIAGDTVVITCATDPGPGAYVSYAMIGEVRRAKPTTGFQRWGLLRDSDPYRGTITGLPQPNYALAFGLTAP